MLNRKIKLMGIMCLTGAISLASSYPIVDTNQTTFYNSKKEISKPKNNSIFLNQDANLVINKPSYSFVGENKSIVLDNITKLMWEKTFRVMSLKDAEETVKKLNKENYLGYNDWRLPSIKELYSLMDFSGIDPSAKTMDTTNTTPFIDDDYFDFEYGSNGSRAIDTQLLSSTIYKGLTMGGDKTVFGLNIADGRIKGYPTYKKRERKDNEFTVRFVRGNQEYGKNNFVDNNDKTITDKATNLMWSKNDSLIGYNWEDALEYVEELNEKNYLGYNDWRMPDAKEMQSIIDYDNSPQSNNKPAIDDIFNTTKIKREDGKTGYGYYWTSTTHKGMKNQGSAAVYFAVGEGLGYFSTRRSSEKKLMDVHGAGSQRSDPKSGNTSRFPQGRGPQGDVLRIDNFVRVVRSVK